MSGDGVERSCSFCDQAATDRLWIEVEGTDDVREAWVCESHLDKLERYNRGEEVDWDE